MDACGAKAARAKFVQALASRRELAEGGAGWAAAKIGPVPGPGLAHALSLADARVEGAASELARAKAACDVRS